MRNFYLTNQYGGKSRVYCQAHDLSPELFGGKREYHPTNEECVTCAAERSGRVHPARVLLWLTDPNFSHTRSRDGKHATIYHRDPDSPSGVSSVGGTSVQMLNDLAIEGLVSAEHYRGDQYMYRTAATA
jgi:hypothetical protein